jgi:hypothetical protein
MMPNTRSTAFIVDRVRSGRLPRQAGRMLNLAMMASFALSQEKTELG